MSNVQSIESQRLAIATLIDLASDRFSEITKDKNSSVVVLGTHDKDLILEVTYYDPKLRKYLLNHVAIKMIRKHKLVDEDEITMFEPFNPDE